jgi:hypothetical protein
MINIQPNTTEFSEIQLSKYRKPLITKLQDDIKDLASG